MSPNIFSRARAGLVIGFLAGALITLLVVLGLTVWQKNAGTSPESPPAPVPLATRSASPSIDPNSGDFHHDHDAAEDEKPGWEPVLLGFAKNFTNISDRSAARWRQSLAPFVSPAVRDQLANVDPRQVPVGLYDSYELLTPGSYQVVAKVTYRQGWAAVVYVTSDGRVWRVTAYDEWQQ